MKRFLIFLSLFFLCVSVRADIASKVVREKVAGLDLIAYPTQVENVVTFRGSLPAGDSFAASQNIAVPTLVGAMLDKGTTKHTKYEIAQKLDAVGARMSFSVSGVMLNFSGKCLRKDLPLVIELLAEQLRTPAFSEEEFAKVKKQLTGNLRRSLESTDARADQAFDEATFPPGHPNYTPPTPALIAAVETAQLDELKKFHTEYYGPANATLVVVGDLDAAELKTQIARVFDGWSGGKAQPAFAKASLPNESKERVIEMPDKPNVTVFIGQATGLRYREPDALPLRVATAALGSGFVGRLMANVRDKEGLTYGIGAGLSGDALTDGSWEIQGNFAPQLLEQGIASTRKQLDLWYERGITAEELQRLKTSLVGSFKVALTTTDGMATALLTAVHRGYDASWLDQYPARIQAISLDEVNSAIKKHLQPDKMTIIKAGSIPPPTVRH